MTDVPRKGRVLVVDDSAAVRALITRVIESDDALEVVATASTGRLAIARIPQVMPDVVILDVMMAEMDGLLTLAAIREDHPRLPVIMFSPLTAPGTAVAVEALFLGANECVAKPAGAKSLAEALDRVRSELLPKVRMLIDSVVQPRPRSAAAVVEAPTVSAPSATEARRVQPAALPGRSRIEAVAIGVSTGGPVALAEVLGGLSGQFPVPVFVVQHMPASFTGLLAERLDQRCALRVAEARPNALPQAGEVWIAPGGRHLLVRREAGKSQLHLADGPPENGCRPSVDVLFESVAAIYGAGTLAVVMTGMGRDGLRGCAAVHAAGGQVLVQDDATSVVWGMPRSVDEAGLADAVLPLGDIADALTRRVQASHRRDTDLCGQEGRS